jgi:hypothetical protein
MVPVLKFMQYRIKTSSMEINYSTSNGRQQEVNKPDDRSYLRQNKSFIIYIGLAMLYFVAFGVILIHQLVKLVF